MCEKELTLVLRVEIQVPLRSQIISLRDPITVWLLPLLSLDHCNIQFWYIHNAARYHLIRVTKVKSLRKQNDRRRCYL